MTFASRVGTLCCVTVDRLVGFNLVHTATSVPLVVASVSCPEDLDNDGWVGLSDLSFLLSIFDGCDPKPLFDPDADTNSDGCVDLGNLSLLLNAFGTSCE